jgi:ubiquinone/menaquinone biosynthesis C-methylase UbiE
MKNKPDAETEFLTSLIRLQYGEMPTLQTIKTANKVSWGKDWPKNNISFWNAEAFMWQHKIDKPKRAFISQQLSFLEGKKNLDLGCGSYSYLKSTGIDFSSKMLDFNENCTRKVNADLEKKLPFKEAEFQSATAIFLLNYIQNYELLLSEINRILSRDGTFVMMLSATPINDWQRQKQVNTFSADKWKEILQNCRFKVNFCEQEGLWIFKCKK